MLNHFRSATVLVLAMTALTGLAYPLLITGLAQAFWPDEANGSLIRKDETVVGSALVGQDFSSDRYFWSRPSETAPDPYNAAASSGSNLGTTSAKLRDRASVDIERLRRAGIENDVPADAVMASGSGLDPHISPAYALAQVGRVAKARGLSESTVMDFVARQTENRILGFIGEPRVNVLELNLQLDALKI